MIWDVKIYLAKIKDGKGKDFSFSNKKNLPTKIPPKPGKKTLPTRMPGLDWVINFCHGLEASGGGLSEFYPPGQDRHYYPACADRWRVFPPGIHIQEQ